MVRKAASELLLVLCVTSILTMALAIKPVKALGYIYIRPDGSVYPETAPIAIDGGSYTLADNVYDSIIIQRDNIVFNGSGFTVQGITSLYTKGIELVGRRNVTITNTYTIGFYYGFYLDSCSDNNIFNNVMADNTYGIRLDYSSHNSITENLITGNSGGVFLLFSFDNCVSKNSILANRGEGIYLPLSHNNTISGNTAIDNNEGVILVDSSTTLVKGNNITANEIGIFVGSSLTNVILENDLSANEYGIFLTDGSSSNLIYHNNFLSNMHQAYDDSRNPFSPPLKPSICSWHNGYPSGGNYWSNYRDEDSHRGPYQNVSGKDGIWDHPYEIDVANIDIYPLVDNWGPFPRSLNGLKTKVENFGSEGAIDNQGIVRSLIAKLDVTEKLIEEAKADEAMQILASFITQVQALTEVHITKEVAAVLVSSAEYIRSRFQP